MTANKESEFKNTIPPTYRDTMVSMVQGEVLLILQNMPKKITLKGDKSEIVSFRDFLSDKLSDFLFGKWKLWFG